jgi:ABC-type branched-subunit amino acid transport system ATPase component
MLGWRTPNSNGRSRPQYGQQKRVTIASILVLDPHFLILG